jgi:homoserine dehydrogenase
VPHLAFQEERLSDVPILDMGEVESSFYLRLRVRDEPGVLSDIAGILAEYKVSIEAMRQRESDATDEGVDIIIITHKTKESSMNHALKKISELDAIYNTPARLRIEVF